MSKEIDQETKDLKLRLYNARVESGLTQKQLSEKIGLRQVTISEYENLKVKSNLPTMKILKKIVLATGSDPMYLLCLDKETEFINRLVKAKYNIDDDALSNLEQGQKYALIIDEILAMPETQNLILYIYDYVKSVVNQAKYCVNNDTRKLLNGDERYRYKCHVSLEKILDYFLKLALDKGENIVREIEQFNSETSVSNSKLFDEGGITDGKESNNQGR